MLDMIFYPNDARSLAYVELSEPLYEWLARSDFSKIGHAQPTPIEVEGEQLALPLIHLETETRQRLAHFLRNQIVDETDSVLQQLERTLSKPDYLETTYRLRKLQELRKCVENPHYQYFQRS
jgi:hypothetical protein